MVAIIAGIFVSMAKKDAPITIINDNHEKQPLAILLGKTNDTQCAMLIKSEENAAEVVAPDGRTWFFDDPGCMVLWLKDKPFKDQATLWVHAIDTKEWVDGRKAFYGVTDPSEMHYGFGARTKPNKETIDFEEMTLRMYRGENLTDPKIRKKLLGL